MRHENQALLVVSIYVDDLLITSSNTNLVDEFNDKLKKVFEMND